MVIPLVQPDRRANGQGQTVEKSLTEGAAAKAEAELVQIAGLLGHSQPSTTLDIYTHAFDKNKKAASEALQQGLEI